MANQGGLGALGSIADIGLSLYRGWNYDRNWNKYLTEQQDPYNQRLYGLSDSLGGLNTTAADTARGTSDYANNIFDPQRISRESELAYRPIRNSLTTLPFEYRQASNTALDKFGAQEAGINQGLTGQLAGYGAQAGAINAGVTGTLGTFGTEAGGINAGYADELNRARGLVEGISGQDRADANRRFDEQRSMNSAQVANSGLGSSTVAGALNTGTERERSDELRRVSDQRLRESLGVESDFGLAGLKTRADLATTAAGLGLQGAGISANLAQTGLQGGINASGISASLANTGVTAGQNAASTLATLGINAATLQQQIADKTLDRATEARLKLLGVIDANGRLIIDTGISTATTQGTLMSNVVLNPPTYG